jgi:hypothetical protein
MRIDTFRHLTFLTADPSTTAEKQGDRWRTRHASGREISKFVPLIASYRTPSLFFAQADAGSC